MFKLLKGAGSRPRTNFCLVARDLYLRNYCWYCRESNVYARRPARAVHSGKLRALKCHGGSVTGAAKYSAYVNKTHAYFGCKSSISVYTRNLTRRRQQQRVFARTVLGSVIFNRLPHSFSTQRSLNKKTLCYGLYLHANIAHTKFERVLNDTDRVLLRNVSLAIWPASCSSQLIKVGVVKQLTRVLWNTYPVRCCCCICEIWRRLEFTITHTIALLKWSVTVLIALLFRYIQGSIWMWTWWTALSSSQS